MGFSGTTDSEGAAELAAAFAGPFLGSLGFLTGALFAFAADLLIAKSSRFFPFLISAAIHLAVRHDPPKSQTGSSDCGIWGRPCGPSSCSRGSTDGLFGRRYPTAIAERRELGSELTSFAAQHRANIVTQLQKSLN